MNSLRRRTHAPAFVLADECPDLRTLKCGSISTHCSRVPQAGGLGTDLEDLPGEANSINFLPRVKVPVLMINGRDDFFFPLAKNQIPMFRLLGTPERDKRHAAFLSGHVVPRAEVIKEVLPWLDRYLGPVRRPESA